MPDTTSLSFLVRGMNSDIFNFNSDEKSYRYALNTSIEDFTGESFNLGNTHSNILAVNLPEGFVVIGRKLIVEQDRVILAILNPTTGESELGEYKNCQYFSETDKDSVSPCLGCTPINKENTPLEKTTQLPYCSYHTIINADCLNFNLDNPVDIEYKITDCGLNIYFTDGFNERRHITFDYLNNSITDFLTVNKSFLVVTGFTDDNCEQPIYSNELDCNKIKYHPSYTRPCIEFVDVTTGGQLKAGIYQAIIAYSDVLGNELTSYSPATNPIPVFDKFITTVTNYVTNKALKFNINNLDQTGLYEYYNLVIVETIDNFTEFKLIGTFPTTSTNHVYTGNDAILKKLDAGDVFFKRPYYKSAKSITKSNDYLFFSGLKEFPKYNIQKYASLIRLYWETIALPETVYFDPRNVNKYRTYQRDEVYALGIVFEADNGEDLCAIHIPAPEASYYAKYSIDPNQIVNNNDVINNTECDPSLRNKNWQVNNLGTVISKPHVFTEKCEDPQTWEYGEFSYWESTDTYPNNPDVWGDLCGQKIRHFRFPDNSITHIHDGKDGAKKFEDNNIIYPIGIRVDINTVNLMLQTALDEESITQEQFDRIKSFRIVRGNRVGNKSIVAKGLLYDVWDYTKDSKFYYANYPYNDLRPDVYISNTNDTYTVPDSDSTSYRNTFRPSGRYTFHSPDTHFTNPSIGDEIKLETLEYGEAEGYFTESELQAKYKFVSTAATLLGLAAGVATALSLTTEKECKVVTYKSDYITNGQDGYGNVSGTLSGAFTLGSGTINGRTSTTGATIDTVDTETHNNMDGTLFNKTTGLELPNPRKVESEQITTCKGSTYQEMNKAGILRLLTGATGAGESIQGLYYRISLGLFEMKKVIDLIEALIPYKNFATQYHSVGKYNNYKSLINNGTRRREIVRSAYLNSQVQLIDENITSTNFSTIKFNNWNRESSLYFKIDETKLLPSPSIQDTSRFVLGQVGEYDDINKRYRSRISSYYGSIKNYIPDQYSNIYKVDYLETDNCSIKTTDTQGLVFGGDTFITRFALKRKMPFFLYTAFELNNQSDIRYQDIGNVGYPNYYFNSGGTIMENFSDLNIGEILNPANIPTLFGVARNRLDTDTQPFFYQKGRIYLYNYGIPYFLVESDINTDFRYGIDNKDGDFYPHQKDLDFWLQEKNVPIRFDNTYYYNTTYSKQNKESFICKNQPNFSDDSCKSDYSYRLIYSEQSSTNSSSYDNWLVFKANNYWDFPISNGRLITADGIENDKVLVRFENTSSIFAAYNTIQTDADSIQIGTGGLFQSRPKEFSKTDLGNLGTQHSVILHTDFGHVWTDAKRGQVILLAPSGGGVEDISQYGMKNWFKENLPFTISKYFPTVDIDNNFKGVGLIMSYDKRFNRLFVTKLDYKPLDSRLQFSDGKFYIVTSSSIIDTTSGPELVEEKQFIELSDTTYFCNKSWTISYNFITKSWVSFHSFIPNLYIDWINYFQSYKSGQIWSHNISNKSYQVYYGKLEPFIVETHTKPELSKSYLTHYEFGLDAYRYHNEYDFFQNELITFNQAILYNNKQCTGLLKLIPVNPENLSNIGLYPRVNNGIEIETSNSQGIWSINDFYDTTTFSTTNQPLFINNCANSNKELNMKAITYTKSDLEKPLLRSDNFFVRLINNIYSNYKFIFKFSKNNKNESI